MKKTLRHAGALALVGWYLMIPPSTDKQAALRQWELVASYDSASACEDGLRDSKVQARADYDHPSPVPKTWAHSTKDWSAYNRWVDERWLAAQCIATDDPRLKGN